MSSKKASDLEIYSAKVIFTRKGKDSLEANVHIRYSKRNSVKEKYIFPEDVEDERSNIEPHEIPDWFRPKKLKTGSPMCVYHRKISEKGLMYLNHQNEEAQTYLIQRLEKLVGQTYEKYKNLKSN